MNDFTDDDAEMQGVTPASATAPAQAVAAQAPSPAARLPMPAAPGSTLGTQVSAHGKVMALIPQNMDEAWKMAVSFTVAGMVPDAISKGASPEQIKARLMLIICKGAELGLGPVSAVQNIMIINNRPCLYGDGVVMLMQRSGVVEYMKVDYEGDPLIVAPEKANYKVTVTIKRKDQTEPYVRSFSYQEAIKARLINKAGPWTDYRARQCYWRALSWCARDACGDALGGLPLAAEIQDYEIGDRNAPKPTDTSSLDDASQQKGHENVA